MMAAAARIVPNCIEEIVWRNEAVMNEIERERDIHNAEEGSSVSH